LGKPASAVLFNLIMDIPNDSTLAAGGGPGNAHVGVKGVVALGLYCVAAFVLCGIAVVELWPHPTPSGTPPAADTSAVAQPPAAINTATTAKPPATPPATDTGTAAKPPVIAPPIDTATGAKPPATPEAAETATAPKPATSTAPADIATVCKDESSRCAKCESAAAALRLRYSSGAKSNDPECVHVLGMWLILWEEERLLLIVLLGGALGALLHISRSFTAYVGARKFVVSWLPWYALTPFVGAFLAMVFYLTIRGGFFSSNAPVGSTSPFGFAAVAALVGMFSRQATEKLLKTFDAIFTAAPDGTDPLRTPAPKPVLDSVTGVMPGPPLQVVLKGSGFTKASKVHIGTNEVPTEWTSDKELKAKVPADQLPAAGQPLSFTVVTPPPGGGTSEARTL
jgi:hypothetical protein